jgi:deoxyribose-phosphate aldolase
MKRNPGLPIDVDWIQSVQVDESEVERQLAALQPRTPGTGEDRVDWLLKAVACVDLTTLSGDDTPDRVKRLCEDAKSPIDSVVLEALGAPDLPLTTAAVCVYHRMLEPALQSLEGTGIPVAAVSAGFPHGLSPLPVRLAEIEASVSVGAQEIDTVIPRFLVLEERWDQLYEEVSAFGESCGDAHLKVILSTGELRSLENVYKTSLVCMMAGADFIKTSTGKEKVNATLPVGMVMAQAIREYTHRTGHAVGLKPAGGLREPSDALEWFGLAREVLGSAWTEPALFRFGASSLLGNLRRELEELAP